MTFLRFLTSIVTLLALTSGARAQVCGQSLAGYSAIVPATGFPQYYVDRTGVALELCLDDGLLCLAPKPDLGAPASVPDNFPEETFYWEADTSLTLPNGGSALVVMATEATFANGAIVAGDQVTFGRLRLRARDVRPNSTYTFTHPFGTDAVQSDALGRLTFTEDSLFFGGTVFPEVNFNGPLAGRVGPFLVWDATAPAPPTGWLGIPTVLHRITGSPCGQNFFRIRGPGLPSAGVSTDLFVVQAKKAAICGNGILDTTEQCDDGNTRDGDCCSSTCTFEAAGSACANTCQVGTTTCDGAGVCTGGSPTLTQDRCDDGNPCSIATSCSAGQCVNGTLPPCAVTAVEADAVVAQASPTTRFGTAKTLEIDGTPVRQGLFRVRVSGSAGQPIKSAKLHLSVGKASGSNSDSGGRVHVASCAWDEATVTWNTRPTFDPAILATIGAVALKQEVEVDVTSAITGDGVYCFAIDSLSADNVIYNSREASASLRPTLVIKTGCASCTAPVCGDNVQNRAAEQCDGFDDGTCPGRCRANCTCGPAPVCGDGIVNQASEQCDGAAAAACPGQCRANCTCPAPPTCGDNLVNQATEVCDGTADAACPGGCRVDCTCTPGTEVPIATVVADTYVAAATPNTNFGAAAIIGADASGVEQAFVRITVSGVGARTVTGATLRLQVADASDSRGRIHRMTDCAWVENTVTWNTRPTFDAAVLNAPAGTAAVGNLVDFDVTAAITGDGTTCFAIDNTSTNGVQYRSREGAAQRPLVLLTVAP